MSDTHSIKLGQSSTDESVTETPTVVVCIGDGGIRKGKKLLELATREGIEERLCLIALNTRTDQFSTLPEDVHTIRLTLPDNRHHEHDKKERPYLHPQDPLGGIDGSLRIRRIARYYMDNPERAGSIEDQLRRIIENFIEKFKTDPSIQGPQAVNIFQYVAAGGGTGSGIMPLMTGLLDTVTKELNEKWGVGFEHWATLSVATVEDFDRGGNAPDVNWRYLGNSLALLDELRAITGYDSSNHPLRIPLMAARDSKRIQRSAYTFESNPFSGVFLLRYDEDAGDNQTYRENVNRTAAWNVLKWMRKDQSGFNGLENEASELTQTFYELRSATFETPTELVDDLLDVKKEYDQTSDSLENLREQENDLTAALDQLRLAIDAKRILQKEELELADETTQVDGHPSEELAKTFQRADEVAKNVDPREVRVNSIEEHVTEFQDRLSYTFHDLLDGAEIQRAVFLAALESSVESAIESHQFRKIVGEFVEERADHLADFDANFDSTAEPRVQYRNTIEPLLSHQLDTLAERIDGFGLTGRITDREEYKHLKHQHDETRARLDEFETALDELEHLIELSEKLSEKRTETGDELENRQANLSSRKQQVEDEIGTLRQEQEAKKGEIDRHKSEIVDSATGAHVTLPVADNTRLKRNRFDEDPGIATLITSGVLDREVVAQYLRPLLRPADDDVLDQQLEAHGVDRETLTKQLTMLCSDETEELVWRDAPVGTPPRSVAADEFGSEPRTVDCNDDTQLALLAVYGNLSLENFDHGRIRETLDQGRPRIWGEKVPLKDCYAYPELLPDTHPVSMQSQLSEIDLDSQGDADD